LRELFYNMYCGIV